MNTHKSEKRPNVGAAVAQELNSATGRKRLVQWLGVFLAFIICVAALTREPTKDMPLQTELHGNVSTREIRAQFYFETPDLARTAEAKKQEASKVPDYFRIDRNAVS